MFSALNSCRSVTQGWMAIVFGVVLSGGAQASLIAEYAFDETTGAVAHDSVGTINGNLWGNAAFVAGAGLNGSGALTLGRSTGDAVSMGDNFGFANYTLSVWVKLPVGYTEVEVPVGKHVAGAGVGYFLAIGDAGDSCCGNGVAQLYPGAYPVVGGTHANVNDGNWHQLVGTFDGSIAALYLDGQLENSVSGATQFNTTNFLVGGTTHGATYDGLIDELRIYDNALDASTVLADYNRVVGSTGSTLPEPTTALLVGMGVLVMLSARKNRHTG